MIRYRKYIILLLNIPFILMAYKAMYLDDLSDTNGLFAMFMLVLLVFYDLYAVIVYNMMGNNEQKLIWIEALFVFFLISPYLALAYLCVQ